MAKRHRSIVATLDQGTAEEWNEDHITDYNSSIDISSAFMGVVLTTEWDTAQIAGTGVAPLVTLTDHHSICELDSGAANNDVSSMRHKFNGGVGNITYAGDSPIHTSRVWLEQYPIGTECCEWGFFEDAGVPFTANQHGAYFRIDTNAIYAVTGDGAAETLTDITPLGGIPEYASYRIELTETNCLFYIDDMKTPVATHILNLPTNDLTLKFSDKNIGGGAGNQVLMYVDGSALKRNVYAG